MINMLHPIEENARKLLVDIARVQGLDSLISDDDLGLLVRRCELWAGYREMCYPSSEVAST